MVFRQNAVEVQYSGVRQHHSDLVDQLMPLTAPTILPGFEPHPSIVAPEVFEKMRLYMDCVDPEERIIREAKMRKTLKELSKDPIARDHISDWKEHHWFPRKSIETEEDFSTSVELILPLFLL